MTARADLEATIRPEPRASVVASECETDEQRQALPAKYHQPAWDGLGYPHSWICAACWGDGWQTSWPCDVAKAHGLEVARAGGMEFQW